MANDVVMNRDIHSGRIMIATRRSALVHDSAVRYLARRALLQEST